MAVKRRHRPATRPRPGAGQPHVAWSKRRVARLQGDLARSQTPAASAHGVIRAQRRQGADARLMAALDLAWIAGADERPAPPMCTGGSRPRAAPRAPARASVDPGPPTCGAAHRRRRRPLHWLLSRQHRRRDDPPGSAWVVGGRPSTIFAVRGAQLKLVQLRFQLAADGRLKVFSAWHGRATAARRAHGRSGAPRRCTMLLAQRPAHALVDEEPRARNAVAPATVAGSRGTAPMSNWSVFEAPPASNMARQWPQ